MWDSLTAFLLGAATLLILQLLAQLYRLWKSSKAENVRRCIVRTYEEIWNGGSLPKALKYSERAVKLASTFDNRDLRHRAEQARKEVLRWQTQR